MALEIKIVEYYNTTIDNHSGEAFKLLSVFSGVGISLLAYKSKPGKSNQSLFTLFPNDSSKMTECAKNTGLKLDGPYSALLIKDDDDSGALADIYEQLSMANITVNESSGIADINGGYGVVLYLDPGDCEKAMTALKQL